MGFITDAALSFAGSTIGAYGAYEKSTAEAAAARYNAKVAGQNAQFARQNAQWAGAEGESQTELAALRTRHEVGKIKVAQAANNVDVNTGSAAAVQKSQSEMGLLNEMNIRSNAARRAYGFEVKANDYVAQANMDRYKQRLADRGIYLNAGSDVVSGVSDYRMNSTPSDSSTGGSGYLNADPASSDDAWDALMSGSAMGGTGDAGGI